MDITFKLLAGQDQASPFYSNRSEALVELASATKLAIKVIEGGTKKDVPASPMEARVTNLRVPAGHWIVLSRENSEQDAEVHLRRIPDGAGAIDSPRLTIADATLTASAGETIGLVKNDLARPMFYRLVVRTDKLGQDVAFHVLSGVDTITPMAGSFVLDTVVPSGGILAINVTEGVVAGHYDLYVDP